MLGTAVFLSASAIAVYSCATRLSPDVLGYYSNPLYPGRLYNPLGYWNAQGLLAAMAIILALGYATKSSQLWLQIVASVALPLVALDCYFTLSRGALVALAIGIGAWLTLEHRRFETAISATVVSAMPIAAVALAHGSPTLMGADFTPASWRADTAWRSRRSRSRSSHPRPRWP